MNYYVEYTTHCKHNITDSKWYFIYENIDQFEQNTGLGNNLVTQAY